MTDTLELVMTSLSYLLDGVYVTLGIVILALVLGLVMGLPMSLSLVYGPKPLRLIISTYVWFFRSLPNLVLLFLFFFGIFPLLGLGSVSPFFVAVVTLGLRSAAYQSQIFKGAIRSISEGQMTAARSLGMTRAQAVKSIILPQAFRVALPGWSNEYPILLTDSAVCYVIGVIDILNRGTQIITRTNEPMLIYLICAVIFILLNYGGMKLIHIIEKKIAIPGFGSGAL